ncbi:hypothetical protein [Microbulbifer sp. JTAC008]|uniref:hypothetical protein n=1 Tax=unclassified Microbulbifer TaxID=2619833 RepID=UPI0040398528
MTTYLIYPFNDGHGQAVLDPLIPAIIGQPGAAPQPQPGHAVLKNIGLIFAFDGARSTYPSNLSAVQAGDRIYIIGHTFTGMKILGSNSHPSEHINQTKIADRLIGLLLPNLQCEIVLWACFAGKGDNDSPGLATLVAGALKVKGHNICCQHVYGFTKKVGTTAKPDWAGNPCLTIDANNDGNWSPLSYYEDNPSIFVNTQPQH